MLSPVVIVDYNREHGPELVRMWRRSFEQAVGVFDYHTFEEQLRFLEDKLVHENHVRVVVEESSSKIIGFMASTPVSISQLYVHVDHQNQGIGSALLEIAKRESAGRLRLFTFKTNQHAQRFYERHGFRIVGYGFEEQWQLEDIEYEWSADLSRI